MKSKTGRLAKEFEEVVMKKYNKMAKGQSLRGAYIICDPDRRPTANPAGGRIRLTSYKMPRFVAWRPFPRILRRDAD